MTPIARSVRRILSLTAVSAAAMIGSETPAAVTFTNVTHQAGIHHVQSIFQGDLSGGETLFMTGGAAAGDFDGDGWIDLYVTRMELPDILYRNVGGQFVEMTEAAFGPFHLDGVRSNGAAWADIDNDGDLDLYITALTFPRYLLYINDGQGNFTEQAIPRGASTNTPGQFKNGMSVAIGDFDRDGWLDLYTTDWASIRNDGTPHARLLRNLGEANPGHFEDKTVAAGLSYNAFGPGGSAQRVWGFTPRFADMDGDGWPDLTIAADFGSSRLFWNNGDGTFTNATAAAGVGGDENGMGSAIGDYDGDGLLDWFVTSIFDPTNACAGGGCNWGTTGNRLYRNNGDRTFSDQTDAQRVRNGGWGWGTSWFDYDNDGDLDLIMVNGIDFPLIDQDEQFNVDLTRVWRNNGPGLPFTDVTHELGIFDDGNGKGLVIFDYDNDGDLDIFIVNHAGEPILYRNDGGNANDYLRIRTIGDASNRDGIGAKITVTPDLSDPERIMFHEITAGSNYLSQNEMIAHFGLGPAASTVDQVVITWPSGIVQTFLDVQPRQLMTVIEAPFALVRGDMDGNAVVDAFDVSSFELALADPAAYAAAHPGINADLVGDMNNNGVFDAFDVGAFEAHLAGVGAVALTPEPGTLAAAGFVGAMVVARRRRIGRSARGMRSLRSPDRQGL